jgi:mannose-1-phosphate guanylyltransferase
MNAYAVIMAGGRGERFWPLSTTRRPKQVLSLVGGKPLIAQSLERLEGVIPPERVFVITGAQLVDTVRAALPALPPANVVGEPFGRDTAAACALGAALVKSADPDGVIAVLTADHLIEDLPVFGQTLRDALSVAAQRDVLITLGIRPTSPSTGFGYIESSEAFETVGGTRFGRARRFIEKPPYEAARGYYEAGNYFWNSGMFVWSVPALLKALELHAPALAALVSRLSGAPHTGADFARLLETEYGKLDRISIDYAVMERADNILMGVGEFRWHDVGSWTALRDHFPADASGNILIGRCEGLDASANIVVSPERVTALIGVRDLVVVHAEGVTLVCHRDYAQDVKKMVAQMERKGGYEGLL